VKVIDVLDIDDSMYIVMEQVTGGDLFDYLVKHVRLKEDEARRLFQQIIDGVDHCHSARVVHRDLKAENILLDEDKNVKIADFGFAAQMTPGEPLTKSCGSPNYAAPELLYKGCSYEGPEIDVWSCGVILYALLTIRLPFDAPNIPDLFRLIKKGSYTVPGHVSEDAKDLISRMLAIDPKDRISIAEIKQHKWFSVGLPKEEAVPAVAEPAVEEAPAAAQPKKVS
jgi:5'-AMP-activated protein kinase catalytic alpha subunit